MCPVAARMMSAVNKNTRNISSLPPTRPVRPYGRSLGVVQVWRSRHPRSIRLAGHQAPSTVRMLLLAIDPIVLKQTVLASWPSCAVTWLGAGGLMGVSRRTCRQVNTLDSQGGLLYLSGGKSRSRPGPRAGPSWAGPDPGRTSGTQRDSKGGDGPCWHDGGRHSRSWWSSSGT